MILFLLFAQFFTPMPVEQRTEAVLSAGIWESCPDDSGDGYAEKALEFKSSNGIGWFTWDLGPRDEFAIFSGTFPEHIPHDDARNLLKPAYHYGDVQTVAGGRNWSIASLGISLNVVAMNQNERECYVFQVLLQRDKRPTLANR